jgi:probable HAF family extracellular repeat protein
VVGDTWLANSGGYPPRGGIWKYGAVTDVGTINKSSYTYDQYSFAYGINEGGEVVGESSINSAQYGYSQRTHAFAYRDGMIYDLGSLGGTYARAVAVNNVEQAVGYGTTAGDAQTHAILRQNGEHFDLGTLPGGKCSQASALNDSGQAVGFATRARADLFGSPLRAQCYGKMAASSILAHWVGRAVSRPALTEMESLLAAQRRASCAPWSLRVLVIITTTSCNMGTVGATAPTTAA